jgi:hypothetical protein
MAKVDPAPTPPKPLKPVSQIRDPMERVVASALDAAGEPWTHGQNGLDFYLSDRDLYIEVKRMHSPRIADQMARAENVIAVQGLAAVTYFSGLLFRQPRALKRRGDVNT